MPEPPTVDPPAGFIWELQTGLSMNPGEAAPGQGLARWPHLNGESPKGYASGWTLDLPADAVWRFEAWRYMQFQVRVNGAETELLAIQPGAFTGFGQGSVPPDNVGLTVGGDGKPTWQIIWLGGPGPETVEVQLLDIVGDAWVAVPEGSGLAQPPGGCPPTNLNTCGGALHPTAGLPLSPEDAEPKFRIEIVRRNRDADRAGPEIGTVVGLTWARMGLDGDGYLLYQTERRRAVTHRPPAQHAETRNVFVKIPGFSIEAAPLFATVDVTDVDGPEPIV